MIAHISGTNRDIDKRTTAFSTTILPTSDQKNRMNFGPLTVSCIMAVGGTGVCIVAVGDTGVCIMAVGGTGVCIMAGQCGVDASVTAGRCQTIDSVTRADRLCTSQRLV